MSTFIYIMDPMCSWCWAFRPSIEVLKKHYPEHNWRLIMGGLAPDTDQPMSTEMQEKIISIWRQIQNQTGTDFNFDFWTQNTPQRNSYPACRAVITAERLKTGRGEQMVNAIQNAYYRQALNPSDTRVLLQLAQQIGFSSTLFSQELSLSITDQQLETEIMTARKLGAHGFPSLFFQNNHGIRPVSLGYCDARELLRRMEELKKE